MAESGDDQPSAVVSSDAHFSSVDSVAQQHQPADRRIDSVSVQEGDVSPAARNLPQRDSSFKEHIDFRHRNPHSSWRRQHAGSLGQLHSSDAAANSNGASASFRRTRRRSLDSTIEEASRGSQCGSSKGFSLESFIERSRRASLTRGADGEKFTRSLGQLESGRKTSAAAAQEASDISALEQFLEEQYIFAAIHGGSELDDAMDAARASEKHYDADDLSLLFSSPILPLLRKRRTQTALLVISVVCFTMLAVASDALRAGSQRGAEFRLGVAELRDGSAVGDEAARLGNFTLTLAGCRLEAAEAKGWAEGRWRRLSMPGEVAFDGLKVQLAPGVPKGQEPALLDVQVLGEGGEWEDVGQREWRLGVSFGVMRLRAAVEMPGGWEERGESADGGEPVEGTVWLEPGFGWALGHVAQKLVLGAGLCSVGCLARLGRYLVAKVVLAVVVVGAALLSLVASLLEAAEGRAGGVMWGMAAGYLGVLGSSLSIGWLEVMFVPALSACGLLELAGVLLDMWMLGEGRLLVRRLDLWVAVAMLGLGLAVMSRRRGRMRSLRRSLICDCETYDNVWELLVEAPAVQGQLEELQSLVRSSGKEVYPNYSPPCNHRVGSKSELQAPKRTASAHDAASVLFGLRRSLSWRRPEEGPVVHSLDQVYAQAAAAHFILRRKMGEWAARSQALLRLKPSQESRPTERRPRRLSLASLGVASNSPETAVAEGGYVKWAALADQPEGQAQVAWQPLKSPRRAIAKALQLYHGDVSKVVDVCRETLYFESVQQLSMCLRTLLCDGEVKVLRVKNTLDPAFPSQQCAGFRFLKVNLRFRDDLARSLGCHGHCLELLLVLLPLAKCQTPAAHQRFLHFRSVRDSAALHSAPLRVLWSCLHCLCPAEADLRGMAKPSRLASVSRSVSNTSTTGPRSSASEAPTPSHTAPPHPPTPTTGAPPPPSPPLREPEASMCYAEGAAAADSIGASGIWSSLSPDHTNPRPVPSPSTVPITPSDSPIKPPMSAPAPAPFTPAPRSPDGPNAPPHPAPSPAALEASAAESGGARAAGQGAAEARPRRASLPSSMRFSSSFRAAASAPSDSTAEKRRAEAAARRVQSAGEGDARRMSASLKDVRWLGMGLGSRSRLVVEGGAAARPLSWGLLLGFLRGGGRRRSASSGSEDYGWRIAPSSRREATLEMMRRELVRRSTREETQLDREKERIADAMEAANAISVFTTSIPIAAALCKRWFRLLLLVVMFVFLYFAYTESMVAVSLGAMSYRLVRFTPWLLHSSAPKQTGVPPDAAPVVASFGILQGGCRRWLPRMGAETGGGNWTLGAVAAGESVRRATPYIWGGRLVDPKGFVPVAAEASEDGTVRYNGFWVAFEPGALAALGDVGFEVEGSEDGVEWTLLATPESYITQAGDRLWKQAAVPPDVERLDLDLRGGWEFLMRTVLANVCTGAACLGAVIAAQVHRQRYGKWSMVGFLLLAVVVYIIEGACTIALRGRVPEGAAALMYGACTLVLALQIALLESHIFSVLISSGVTFVLGRIIDATLLFPYLPALLVSPPVVGPLLFFIGVFLVAWKTVVTRRSFRAIQEDQAAYAQAWEAVWRDDRERRALEAVAATCHLFVSGHKEARDGHARHRQRRRSWYSRSRPRLISDGDRDAESVATAPQPRRDPSRPERPDRAAGEPSAQDRTPSLAGSRASRPGRQARAHAAQRTPSYHLGGRLVGSGDGGAGGAGGAEDGVDRRVSAEALLGSDELALGLPSYSRAATPSPQTSRRSSACSSGTERTDAAQEGAGTARRQSAGEAQGLGGRGASPGGGQEGSMVGQLLRTLSLVRGSANLQWQGQHQVVRSLDQVYVQAEGLHGRVVEKVQQWAQTHQGLFPVHREDREGPIRFVAWGEASRDEALARSIKWAALKRKGRAIEKLVRSYQGDPSRLVDVCRQAVVFERCADMQCCLSDILEDPDVVVCRIKNRMHDSYDARETGGYRDLCLNLRLDTPDTRRLCIDHHVFEIQLILMPFAQLKNDEGHARYVVFRNSRGE